MTHTPSAAKRSFQAAQFAHGTLVELLKDFPESKAAHQPCPSDNHLLWHLGHLAVTYEWFAAALDGKPKGGNEAVDKLFASGSKPVADAKAYPPVKDVRARFDAAWTRLMNAAESLRDEDAAKPALVEGGGFLKDRLDTVDKAAWHDGWHAGQISGLRKALGLKPMWG